MALGLSLARLCLSVSARALSVSSPGPAPTRLLDGIAAAPVVRAAGARTATTGQSGPIASVAVGSGAAFDVTSAAEADAAGATKVVGYYLDGINLSTFDTRLDYVNDNGNIVGKNNGAVERTAPIAAGIRTALGGSTGFTLMSILKTQAGSDGSSYQLITLSSDQSTTTTMVNLSINQQGNLSAAYRRLHGDTAVTRLSGEVHGGFEILDFTIAYNEGGTRRIRAGRRGTNFWTDNPVNADPVTTEGAPQAATIRVPPGASFYGALLWKGALSDADIATLRANARSQFASQYASGLADMAATWWTRNADRSPDGSRVVITYTNGSGVAGGACQLLVGEFDYATRGLLEVKAADPSALYSADEHMAGAAAFTPSGKLVIWVVPHNNAIDGTSATANRIKMLVSDTGRVADLFPAYSFVLAGGTAGSGANYASPVIVDDNTWLCFTNQDNQVAHRIIRTTGGNAANTIQCVNIFGGIPAGMTIQPQTYLLCSRISPTTLRMYLHVHSANVRNLTYCADLDLPTGNVTSNGSVVGNAYAAYASSTPLINLATTPPAVVFDPGEGNSFRLMDAVGDEIYGATGPNSGVGWKHIAVANGVVYELGDAGAYFGGTYHCGIMRAREPHAGRRFVRTFNDGNTSGTYTLERLDMPALGGAISRTPIITTSTDKLLRPLLIENTGPAFAGVVAQGGYSSFTSYRTSFRTFAGA